MALVAREASLMPRFAQSGEYCILNVLVAMTARLTFHTFLVESNALDDDVVSGNTTTTLVTRKEVSCAILAQNLTVVVEVGAVQLCVTFSTLEMVLVEMLSASINVLMSEKGISALVAVGSSASAARR